MQQKKGASGAPYIKLEVKAEISDSFELDFNVPLNFIILALSHMLVIAKRKFSPVIHSAQ